MILRDVRFDCLFVHSLNHLFACSLIPSCISSLIPSLLHLFSRRQSLALCWLLLWPQHVPTLTEHHLQRATADARCLASVLGSCSRRTPREWGSVLVRVDRIPRLRIRELQGQHVLRDGCSGGSHRGRKAQRAQSSLLLVQLAEGWGVNRA